MSSSSDTSKCAVSSSSSSDMKEEAILSDKKVSTSLQCSIKKSSI